MDEPLRRLLEAETRAQAVVDAARHEREAIVEAALQHNHVLHDPKQPIEILRTVHSFDPCLACAVHVTDPDGEELIEVKVR